MKHTKEELDNLMDSIRDSLRGGLVCDSINRCEMWERMYSPDIVLFNTFKFCPFCGKKIKWDI